MTLRSLRIAAVLLAVSACGKRAPGPSSEPSASAPSVVSMPNIGPLGSPTAFELVAHRAGATLVWAPVARESGALRSVELDADGVFSAPAELALAPAALEGELSDLAASWVKERLALAWVERQGGQARIRAAWAATGAPAFELGKAYGAPRGARGNLVLAARDERALVFARGDETSCIEAGRRGCFGFAFHELSPGKAERTGLPMTVPVPCSDHSAALSVVGDRFHYGVCTDTDGRPVTTVFTIEQHPEYARAEPVLEGCMPSGTFVWHGAAWLVAECEGGRRAARLGAREEAAEYLDLRAPRLECRGGSATLRASSLALTLEEPRADLTPLLPEAIAPAGSRAVWAGRALVVATSTGDRIRLIRRACRGDELVSTALEVQ